MPSPRHSLATLSVLLSFFVSSFADTVTLKSGEKLDGRILNESDTELTIEVAVNASIKDQRVVKKADVAKIEKAQPDLEAWAVLKNISLGEDSLESTDYGRGITLLNNFVASYPQSANVAEAKKKVTELQDEMKRVDAGEMKVAGKWLTADEVKDERVQITGRQLLARMKRNIAAGQLSEAMTAFDSLEKSAGGSSSYPDAVVLARQTTATLKAAAEQGRIALKAQLEEGKRRLAAAQGHEHTQLEAIQKQRQTQTDAMVANLEKSGVKWFPLSPANDKSLSAISIRAGGVAMTLNQHNVQRMKDSLAATERAKEAIEKNDGPAAEKALAEASSAWPKNEYITRLQPKIALAKTAAADAAREAAEAAKVAAAKAITSQLKPVTAPLPTPNPLPPVAEAPEKSGSILASPFFWIVLVILGGAAALGMKLMRKKRESEQNELDQ